jgi:hypothetical protein
MKLYVYCKGDPDTGIPGSAAEVEIDLGELAHDSEELLFAMTQIRECFTAIWDDATTVVMTEVDVADDET